VTSARNYLCDFHLRIKSPIDGKTMDGMGSLPMKLKNLAKTISDFHFRIKSVIDGKAMDGIGSLRIHSGPDILQDNLIIRSIG
jgi:hypothetical protein